MKGESHTGVIGKVLSSTFPPIFILFAVLAGIVALILTPKEEDPQIVVPMADIVVSAPGLSSTQMSSQVTEPVERLVSQIDGVEYVYSQSNRDHAIITVRFYVGEERESSLVKLYNKLYSHQDEIPSFVTNWAIKPVEIDDVPIVVAALYSTDPQQVDSFTLRRVAEESTQRLKAIPQTNRVSVVGGESRRIQISINSSALAAHQTTIEDIGFALDATNSQRTVGSLVSHSEEFIIESGEFLSSASDISQLVINVVNGRPVYLRDVATVHDNAHEPENYTLFYPSSLQSTEVDEGPYPAVFLAVAKQRGANAVAVADNVLATLTNLEDNWLPDDVRVEVIRNYGETADGKVTELVSSLAVAIIVVVVFVGLFLNWRAAAVVAIAIPISYGATLGVDLLLGYTINRVTMFALILALGLIVDDPIAAIDNIERHISEHGSKTKASIVSGMMEIKSALLMSTLAIVIVFTPMFFITGMMGPYMAPMAFNVPIAVLFSTITAFLVTPWLAWKIMKVAERKGAYNPQNTILYKGYRKLLEPVLNSSKSRRIFLWSVFGLFIVAATLPALRLVPLKLLPNDNKNEFQIIVNMKEGSALEETSRTNDDLARYLQRIPEVKSVSSFAGVASPMDFNGMVRHYFRRNQSYQGELRVVLVDKFRREMQSNEVVTRLRDDIEAIAQRNDAQVEIVQMPPGPPVLATIVAEIYGDESTPYTSLQAAARTVAGRLQQEDAVSQVDTSIPASREVWRFIVDQEKAARSGIAPADIHQTLAAAMSGEQIGILHIPSEVNPLPIEIRLPPEHRHSLGHLMSLMVRGRQGFVTNEQSQGLESAPAPMVALSELGEFVHQDADMPIFHKNLRPVSYVYAEVTGRVPADAVVDVMADQDSSANEYRAQWTRNYFANGAGLGWSVPEDIEVVWNGEGEWKITLDVFRDLGIAYGVALLGVYIVMVLQTGLKAVSGIMMLSIPLTIIGIMPGFWFLNLFASDIGRYENPTLFTATAMIGMIALAGIVVRNALILIEFIQQRLQTGCDLKDALYDAGAARTRPILLTAGTTMLANIVITLDPIFNGLAWAVIFGITASTVFTLLVIPVVYYSMYHDSPNYGLPEKAQDLNEK